MTSQELEVLATKKRTHLPDVRALAECQIDSREFSRQTSLEWGNRTDIFVTPKLRSSVRYALFERHLTVWICSRKALDRLGSLLYVELAFRGVSLKDIRESQRAFWSQSDIIDKVLKEGTVLAASRPPRPLYIPAEFGHPLGYIVFSALNCVTRLKSLLVAFHGDDNPVFCSHCVRSYTSNISGNRKHFVYPFHTCRSLPGFMGGQCANCIWGGDNSCEWRHLPGYLRKGPRDGPLNYPLGGSATSQPTANGSWGQGSINKASCPRISCAITLPGLQTSLLKQAVFKAEQEAEADRLCGF
ncbi:hypothetical protein BKA56DRAFT_625679 [Ilyonectria sp. MPI-CAGE-AT-0026]|nr:hypothetical protein BKA56DRAFT_625679 [Ilyonectria sp. MPI-CAGE-AT-0026]